MNKIIMLSFMSLLFVSLLGCATQQFHTEQKHVITPSPHVSVLPYCNPDDQAYDNRKCLDEFRDHFTQH